MQISNVGKISAKLGQGKEHIRTLELSQGNIARVLKIDRGYVGAIENGKKTPTLATIQNLADALGTSADELLK